MKKKKNKLAVVAFGGSAVPTKNNNNYRYLFMWVHLLFLFSGKTNQGEKSKFFSCIVGVVNRNFYKIKDLYLHERVY